MKLRSGFVSNSSTASFIVKTKSDDVDKLFHEEAEMVALAPEKIRLLKKCGFKYTNVYNPFMRALYVDYMDGDKKAKTEEEETPFLFYWIDCNQEYIAQFLVANDIPFKAAVHYGHELYSYEQGDDYIYILYNYGIEYFQHPKEIVEEIKTSKKWRKFVPFEKIDKKEFLKDYDEKESLQMMGVENGD